MEGNRSREEDRQRGDCNMRCTTVVMTSLVAAVYYKDKTQSIAMTPRDFKWIDIIMMDLTEALKDRVTMRKARCSGKVRFSF